MIQINDPNKYFEGLCLSVTEYVKELFRENCINNEYLKSFRDQVVFRLLYNMYIQNCNRRTLYNFHKNNDSKLPGEYLFYSKMFDKLQKNKEMSYHIKNHEGKLPKPTLKENGVKRILEHQELQIKINNITLPFFLQNGKWRHSCDEAL